MQIQLENCILTPAENESREYLQHALQSEAAGKSADPSPLPHGTFPPLQHISCRNKAQKTINPIDKHNKKCLE